MVHSTSPRASDHGGEYHNPKEAYIIDKRDRPKDHHVFDVLHFIKKAFKKHALDDIKEGDCLNKEAYRYVLLPP